MTPTRFLANFLVHIFDAWLQMICNAAVPDIPLYQYKRNWHITCDLPDSKSVLRVAFLILSGICLAQVHNVHDNPSKDRTLDL